LRKLIHVQEVIRLIFSKIFNIIPMNEIIIIKMEIIMPVIAMLFFEEFSPLFCIENGQRSKQIPPTGKHNQSATPVRIQTPFVRF